MTASDALPAGQVGADRRRWAALGLIAAAQVVVIMDMPIISVALLAASGAVIVTLRLRPASPIHLDSPTTRPMGRRERRAGIALSSHPNPPVARRDR